MSTRTLNRIQRCRNNYSIIYMEPLQFLSRSHLYYYRLFGPIKSKNSLPLHRTDFGYNIQMNNNEMESNGTFSIKFAGNTACRLRAASDNFTLSEVLWSTHNLITVRCVHVLYVCLKVKSVPISGRRYSAHHKCTTLRTQLTDTVHSTHNNQIIFSLSRLLIARSLDVHLLCCVCQYSLSRYATDSVER